MFPETIGECIDELYVKRAARLEAQKRVDEMKEEEDAYKAHILARLDEENMPRGGGEVATASVTHRVVGRVQDWDAVYKYVVEKGAFDLLHKRISDTAYRDRLELNEVVPGIEPITLTDLSLVKASRKD